MTKTGKTFVYAILILVLLATIFPIWWIFATSLESSRRAYSFPAALWPNGTLHNYTAAWHAGPWLHFFLNSVGIGVATTLLVLLTSLLAGYALVYLPNRASGIIFTVILATMMVPFYSIIIPDYLIIKDLGWLNTYASQIIPFAANGFSVFLLMQFMRSLPKELWDAARIDGISTWGFLWRVAVPNLKPAMATVSIYVFLLSWNAFLWPFIVTAGPRVQPIQVGLANMLSTANGTNWTVLSAAAAFTAIPVLVLYALAQRSIVESVSRTGIKG
jgi:multiple sugar transport system permease protein